MRRAAFGFPENGILNEINLDLPRSSGGCDWGCGAGSCCGWLWLQLAMGWWLPKLYAGLLGGVNFGENTVPKY